MQHAANCLNCGSALAPDTVFCAQCGQKAAQHRLSLSHLLHEFVHFFTHADKGIFFLIKMLIRKPGQVAQEYIGGRRKKYFPPLNFYLIVVGLFVFVQTTFRPSAAVNMNEARTEVQKIPNQTVRERRLAKLDRMEKASNFMARYSNYVNMAVTPIVALLFFLFYRRSGFNYTEHLVANLFFAGMTSLFYIVVITPYLLLTKGSPVYLLGIFFFLLFEVGYRAFGYYGFIGKRGWRGALYAVFVSFITVSSWYMFSRTVITYYIERGFG